MVGDLSPFRQDVDRSAGRGWLSAGAFAGLAGVAPRVARKALARALAGKPWNGHHLQVRTVPSRGGASGLAYEVAVASLPQHIADKLRASVPAPAMPPRPASGADWRLRLVLRVIEAGPPGSEARAAQLAAVASQAARPHGKRAGQPIAARTLRAWIAAYEARGMLPLATRTRRADRGASRVIAWREWDRAMAAAGVPEARQRDIAATLHAEVLGLWKAGEASAANVAFCMGPRCRDLAEAAGVSLPEDAMSALCRMPSQFAGRKDRRRARVAHIKRTDAARWHANHVPRVRRHRNGLRPMDLVAADVRHSDILYRRPDGSLATAKIICFLDLATNRLFARPFLLPKGEMIRREHVLTALRDLAADPAWGLWRGLYLDNGGEFSLGEAPEDLAHLVNLVRTVHGEEAATGCGTITSLPHNPQSKVIEGVFSAITRSVEPIYPGFIGGNRMAKKSANQGREPVPMDGDEAAIVARYAEMVAFYNAKPQQRGHVAGRSPNDAFGAFIADAAQPWRAITLDAGEFSLAFGPDEFRMVQPGGELHIRNRVLTHPDLAGMVGERVRVRLPILAPSRAVLLTDKGDPVLVAAEAEAFDFRDRAGARAHHAGRRGAKDAAQRATSGAAKVVPAAMRKRAVASLPAPMPLPPVATASLHPVLRAAADVEPAAIEPTRRQAEERRRIAEQEAARKAVAEAYRRAG
jgi:hypothetical protein